MPYLGRNMRKELSKALRAEILKVMRNELPQFESLKRPSESPWSGSLVFRRIHSDSLWMFVEFYYKVRGPEAVYVELGWSRLSRYPEVVMRPSFISNEMFSQDKDWVRLKRLRTKTSDDCYVLDERQAAAPGPKDPIKSANLSTDAFINSMPVSEATARIYPLIKCIMEDVQRYGIPFFEKLIQDHASP